MAINISIQYNGGFLPDTILLTQCYDHSRGTRLNAIKRFCLCSLRSHLNVLTSPPLTTILYILGDAQKIWMRSFFSLNTCHVANSPKEIRARAVME